jgi:hypothetical protein
MSEQPPSWQPEYPPQEAPAAPSGGRGRSAALKKVGLVGAGVVAGAVIATAVGAAAATSSPSTTTPSTSTAAPGGSSAAPDRDGDHGPAGNGTFHSNEDPAHEKGESAAREAQEDAGQAPTVP